MSIVKIRLNNTLPENPGANQLISAGDCSLSVTNGVVILGGASYVYTATTGTLPSDQELFDLWEPVAGAANGASGPAIVAPVVVASNGDILYPGLSA